MLKKLYAWFEERLGVGGLLRYLAGRPVPRGVNWAYTLGSATLFLIILQVVTGILLTIYYAPTPDHAYDSVVYITNEVLFGWLIRGIHKWSASLLVIVVFLHMLRVFFSAAYKYPRELTWVVGVGLLLLVLAFGFTGYLLPWDQKAYWATVVGTHIVETVPILGPTLMLLVRGGAELGAATLNRFYSLHIWILPAALFLLIGLHLFMVIKQGISVPPPRDLKVEPWEDPKEAYQRYYEEMKKKGTPFFPAVVWKDAVVAFLLFITVMALTVFWGAPLEEVADPTSVGYAPRPEWYFLFLYRLLWYFKGPWEVVGTFIIPTVVISLLFALPFIDRGPERHLRKRPTATFAATSGVAALVVLTYLGATAPAPPAVATAVTPPPAVTAPSETPVVLTGVEAGREVYEEQGCGFCHTINGAGAAVGPDLSHIGSQRDAQWLDAILRDPQAVSPGAAMPGYGQLSHEEMDSLTNYLTSLK